jgi:hypothetical protein
MLGMSNKVIEDPRIDPRLKAMFAIADFCAN